MSIISSLIAPVKAKCNPILSSSNFGQRTPGVSKSSKSFFVLIHCTCFVTPGLSPIFALFLFEMELIKVDFPTLGIPTIIILIVFEERFFSSSFLNLSANISLATE